ncbi:hypothetical protein SDC9_90169 [bioreactor metagenome]|uniref:Uncharacterized protein n=1 Tax=bioreactor metagenome TaxID=1076179 RepID=A0A645A0Z2_9ZZZZ
MLCIHRIADGNHKRNPSCYLYTIDKPLRCVCFFHLIAEFSTQVVASNSYNRFHPLFLPSHFFLMKCGHVLPTIPSIFRQRTKKAHMYPCTLMRIVTLIGVSEGYKPLCDRSITGDQATLQTLHIKAVQMSTQCTSLSFPQQMCMSINRSIIPIPPRLLLLFDKLFHQIHI